MVSCSAKRSAEQIYSRTMCEFATELPISRDECRFPLLDFPGVAGPQQLGQVARPLFLDHLSYLLVDHVFIARQVVPGPENTDGRRESRSSLHMRKKERIGRTRVVRVVNHKVGFRNAVAELDNFDVAVELAAD